jgi:hypothetical protein
MKTREFIIGCAYQNNWERVHVEHKTWLDAFERQVYVDPRSKLGKFVAQCNWMPKERVVVQYNGSHGNILASGSYYGPGQQSALTGEFTSPLISTEGRDRKAQIIEWLEGK